MKKYASILVFLIVLLLSSCKTPINDEYLVINYNIETKKIINVNHDYEVIITDQNVLIYFEVRPKSGEIKTFERLIVNKKEVKNYEFLDNKITFYQISEHPTKPDEQVNVDITLKTNGGYWTSEQLTDLEASSAHTITSKNDYTGSTFSLHDSTTTGLRWYYKLFLNYNETVDLYEVVYKDLATAQVSMLNLPEYDFIIGVAANYFDAETREQIIHYTNQSDPLFASFNLDPASYTEGDLVISFYEDSVISGNLTKTYLESATLPIPYKKGFTFVGWSDGVNVFSDYSVHQAKDKVVEVTYEAIWQEKTVEELETFLDELIPLVIDENLYFETSYSAFDLQFDSSTESVISNEGIYTRPYKDQNVRLSVHVYEANQLIKTINYDVIAKGYKSLDSSFASSYIYRNYSQVDDLFFETLDVINTAFITANSQGNLSGSSYLSNVKQYIMPRAKENGNWVIMSVAPESSWSSIASSQQSIDTLANQIVEFINVHGFDGVDIDWETPTDSEKTRFTALMKTVYQKVKSNNPNHLVTTAITGGMWQPPRYDLINSQIYLDYINLMTYGMTSSNGQYQNALYKSTTFHNTSLKLGASLNTASIDESVKMLKNSYGVPYSKIVVGVAFYGIKQTRIYNEQTNTFDAFKNAGSVYYNHIENIYMTDSSYELVYDTGAGVPYIYKKDGTEFISFDNPQSILEKGNYILKNKLGGMMFWEYGTDPTNRLLEAVKQGMGK
ncbi:hypothetical protein,containing chitinase domain [Paracholeplasma brassicae]|uniref:chitinase n=1 Tax=Acholeplasma brassicae TaxID=61635 RepID=U4KN24_9MOLU|nr:glycosyl hydrolase family 18 protein [Paracholeplasma brassicae]CCV65692.1 hypothetical protein,containing chitinase domain [Paracholeplasma brassicae]